jgi:anti-sigma regulatory factor (Ser/Thr protein kinase)
MGLYRPVIEHFAAFEAQQNPIDHVRAFVQAALLETPLEKKAIAGLMLAVEEAVTNTIRHGYMYGPGRLHVRVRSTRQWVSVTITDSGRAYSFDTDPALDARQLADTGRRGGLGQYLMRKVSDQVDYRRVGDENILSLIKRFRPAAQALPKSGLRRRIAWTGTIALAASVIIGAWLIERQTTTSITSQFFDQWSQFGRTAAAATGQHFLNDRSDAEFDQLAVGLKSAYPGLAYLVILSGSPTVRAISELRIRAHSESPESVHELYAPPQGVPVGQEGRWLTNASEKPVYHFCHSISLDGRRVGMVVWAVPESQLAGLIQSERGRIIRWSLAIVLAGALLIFLGSNWMTRPIQKMLASLRVAGSRGIEVAPPTAGPDEIREVVAAFNEATETVAQTHREMAERDVARREMEASQQLQRALLPRELPKVPGYEFGATCRMARQVGGDYYDMFTVGPDHWLIIVADVAGKGFPAALLMTSFRTATRLLAPSHPSPADLLQALHEFLTAHPWDLSLPRVACRWTFAVTASRSRPRDTHRPCCSGLLPARCRV